MTFRSTKTLDVSLSFDKGHVIQVGRLAYRDGRAYLEYDSKFYKFGLNLSPFHHRTTRGLEEPFDANAFEGLHGMFADSIPDGWGRLLIDRIAERNGITPYELTPLDRLAIIGKKGIGALTYKPEIELWEDTNFSVDLDQIAKSTQTVLEGKESEVLDWLGRTGASPNGARPKALIWLDEVGGAVTERSEIREGMIPYLVKFRASDDESDKGAIEYAYSLMAREAGVDMSRTRLIEGQSGVSYFATKRFDLNGGARMHVHSASGMLYANTKYSTIDYIDLLKLTFFVARDVREVLKMFRLAVFNVLSHNRDDHSKQFSYTMDREGVWRMAPAYDLTFSHGVGGEHSTAVCGFGKDIKREHLLQLASTTQVSEKQATEIIEEVEFAVSCWGKFSEMAKVTRQSRLKVATQLEKIRKSIGTEPRAV